MTADTGERYKILYEFGQMITSEVKLDVLFTLIVEQTNRIMGTQRCSVFLHDDRKAELWTLVSTDLGKDEVRIPAEKGVAGWVFRHRTPLIINNPYEDERFFRKVDETTGFHTQNILCIPLINRGFKCIGTLQTLNKIEGAFGDADREMLTAISDYVTIALENARLYEDLTALDKARERVIDHLAHELKTPLAIILAVLIKARSKVAGTEAERLGKSLARAERNVLRLMALQEKIDDILKQEASTVRLENRRLVDLIETAVDLVAALQPGETPARLDAAVIEHLRSLVTPPAFRAEEIAVGDFLTAICTQARAARDGRHLEVAQAFEPGLRICTDPQVLRTVCEGLLRNAIENTPDGGRVEVRASREAQSVTIGVRDFGVGIGEQNRKLIFGGFFHTLDTGKYSSKRPYAFNAGGSGADLLRIKTLSERYGFTVGFESRRCRFLPGDADLCPGHIEGCPHVATASQCRDTGGSDFFIRFPAGGTETPL